MRKTGIAWVQERYGTPMQGRCEGAKVRRGREGDAKDVCSITYSHYPSRCIVCTKSLSGQHHLAVVLLYSPSHHPTHSLDSARLKPSGDSPSQRRCPRGERNPQPSFVAAKRRPSPSFIISQPRNTGRLAEDDEKECRQTMQVPPAGLGVKPSRFPEPLKKAHSISPAHFGHNSVCYYCHYAHVAPSCLV